MNEQSEHMVCQVRECPGFGTAHPPLDLPPVVVTAKLSMRGGCTAATLAAWSSKLPIDAEVAIYDNGETLVARWTL